MSNIPLGLFSDVFWWVSVHKAVGLSCLNHAWNRRNCRESYIPPRPTCCFFRSFSFTRCLKAWIQKKHQNLRSILIPFKLSVGKINFTHHSRQVWGFWRSSFWGFKIFRGRINHLTMIPKGDRFTRCLVATRLSHVLDPPQWKQKVNRPGWLELDRWRRETPYLYVACSIYI